MEVDHLVAVWRKIIVGDDKSWVLFENGTCVILMKPEEDLAAQAKELMEEWGPVQVGTPSADFNVIELQNAPGWLVTCHNPDILDYVPPNEFGTSEPSDLLVGLTGRQMRAQDAEELNIVHVEAKRSQEV
jgi:hypothetical protein